MFQASPVVCAAAAVVDGGGVLAAEDVSDSANSPSTRATTSASEADHRGRAFILRQLALREGRASNV